MIFLLRSHPLKVDCSALLKVSTADQSRSSPQNMISCNKKSLYLPQEMPAIHAEFTEYYFTDGKDYPSKTEGTTSIINADKIKIFT